MAASEVSAWGGFVVSLPACPGLPPAPRARPCRWVTQLGLSPPSRDTHGSASPGCPRLGMAWEPSPPWGRHPGKSDAPRVRPPARRRGIAPHTCGSGWGDTGEGGGGKGVTGCSNLRM